MRAGRELKDLFSRRRMDVDERLKNWFGEAYDEAADTLHVKLGQTVKINGEDVDEVTLREPTIGHVEAATKKEGAESDRMLMAYLVTGATPAMFLSMPAREYAKAMAFLRFFMRSGPPTGEPA
jgi:hypothetical protein